MGATTVRQWLILSMLPKPPRRVETALIERRLRERGIEIHRRTIQRDLVELARVFPIIADDRAKPFGWRWLDDASFLMPLPAVTCGPTEPAIRVSIRVRRGALRSLLERLRASDHELADDPTDPARVTAVVVIEDSDLSRRLLLGHTDEVEVVAPLELRRQIAQRARQALASHTR